MNIVLDFFVDKKTHPFDLGEMRLLFASWRNFYERLQSRKSPTWRTAREFVYDNGDTGVYFTLRYNEPEKFDLTAGRYTFSGLCFEMELPRADFFGHEAMRVVAAVTKELSLMTSCSSHAPDIPAPPGRLSYDELMELWLGAKRQEATEEAGEGGGFAYAGAQKLMYWWRYALEKGGIREREGSAVAVPAIRLCRKKDGIQALTVCEWRGAASTILPVVDYVLIERPVGPVRRREGGRRKRPGPDGVSAGKAQWGMARYEELVHLLKGFCEETKGRLPYMVYSRRSMPPAIRNGIRHLELGDPADFENVMPDRVLDAYLMAPA